MSGEIPAGPESTSLRAQAFGPVPPTGLFRRYLTPGEQLRVTVRPKLAAFVSVPAIVIVGLSVALYALGIYAATSAVTAAVTGGWTAAALQSALQIVGFAFLAAWILAIIGAVVWFQAPRWVRAILGVVVGLGLPYVFFTTVVLNILNIRPGSINSAASAASTLNGILWLSFAETSAFLVLIALVIPLLLSLLAWRNAYYALTDRRVLKVGGLVGRHSREARLDMVYDVSINEGGLARSLGYGDLVLSTSPGSGDPLSPARTERKGLGIAWYGVPQADEVRQVAHELMEGARRESQSAQYAQMASAYQAASGGAYPGPPPSAPRPMPTAAPGAAPNRMGLSVAICSRCGTAAGYSSERGGFWCANCNAPV